MFCNARTSTQFIDGGLASENFQVYVYCFLLQDRKLFVSSYYQHHQSHYTYSAAKVSSQIRANVEACFVEWSSLTCEQSVISQRGERLFVLVNLLFTPEIPFDSSLENLNQ